MIRRLLMPAIALAAAVLILACGSDDKSSSGSSSPPASTLENVNLSESVLNLESLESFRFDLAMKIDVSGGATTDPFAAALLGAIGNITAQGAFVAPDQEVNLSMLGQAMSFIEIGDKAWLNVDGTWQVVSPEDLSFAPDFEGLATELLPDSVLKVARTTRERVNGVDTVHYSFDKASLAKIAEELGEEVDLAQLDAVELDLWLASNNVPVKVTMYLACVDASGQKVSMTLAMNITDINDAGIKIKPPA